LMCWAACDRLARIAERLALGTRAAYWRDQAATIRASVLARAWSAGQQSFVESSEDGRLDASTLLLADFGIVDPHDSRFVATVDTIGRTLRRGEHLLRYEQPDDFGAPATAFNICTFWYVDALGAIGRREQAREMFDALLLRRNALGMLSEDIDFASGELWGNFPQTYSLVGLINAAMRLSRRWEEVV